MTFAPSRRRQKPRHIVARQAIELRRLRHEDPAAFALELERIAERATAGSPTRDFWSALVELHVDEQMRKGRL